MTTSTHPFERLFSPLAIGSKRARNCVVRAATTTNLAERNAVSDRMIAHYSRIAEGGVGTIVTDALRIHRGSYVHHGISAYDESSIEGLSRLSLAVRDRGALIIGQLNHSGRQHLATTVPPRLVAPSAVACPRSGGVPHPLSLAEVAELQEGFVASARNLSRAGFDGVELNGAQGHLLQQFLSPFSNRRTDGYGGSPESRATFAIEILQAIRQSVDRDFLVGYRLGVDEFTEGGLTTELTAAFARQLEQRGLVDYVSFSQGNFNSIDAHLPDRHYAETPFAHVQARVGEALNTIIRIACTRIQRPDQAERILAEGWADAVALGRAITVDPAWPAKAAVGDTEAIRPCIQCNFCWSGLHEGENAIACVQNAEVGRELELGSLRPSKQPRHVVIVGGGPAGLETARVAAQRGHRVTLFEKRQVLGGKTGPGADAGGHDDYRGVAIWLIREVGRLGITIHLGRPATPEMIIDARPDIVVIATGARPVLPEVESDGSVSLAASLEDVPRELSGERAVVVDEDGHYWAAQTAEELARRGADVTVITRFFEAFRELPIVSRVAALRRLDEAGSAILPMHEVTRIRSGGVDARHYDSHRPVRLDDIDRVVWVGPQLPEDEVVAALTDRLPDGQVKVIGDAYAPRRLHHAIREGFDLAWSLE